MAGVASDDVEAAQTALKTEAAEASEQGKLHLALEKLTDAIKLGRPGALLYSRRAKVLLELGSLEAAIEDCSAAIAINRDSGAAYKIRGKAHAKLERWDAAHSDLSVALAVDYDEQTDEIIRAVARKSSINVPGSVPSMTTPIEANSLRTESATVLEEGKPELALEKLTEMINANSSAAPLYIRRAKVCLELGRPCAAVDDCTAALALDASLAIAFKLRGKALAKMEDWEEAHIDLCRGLEMEYDEDTSAAMKSVSQKRNPANKVEGDSVNSASKADSNKVEEPDVQGAGRNEAKQYATNVAAAESFLDEPEFPAMSPVVVGRLSDDKQDAQNALKNQAMDALEDGKLDLALQKFTEAIQLGCASALLYSRRAKLLLELHRPHAAMNDCEAALRLNADCGAAHKICGSACMTLHRWEEANKYFGRALSLDYDDVTDEMAKVAKEKLKYMDMQKGEQPTLAKRKLDCNDEELLREDKRRKAEEDNVAREAELDREWMRQKQAEIEEEEAERDREWMRQKQAEIDEEQKHEEEQSHDEGDCLGEQEFPPMSGPIPVDGLTEEASTLQNSLKCEAVEALEAGKLDVALDKLTESIRLGCTSALLYCRRAKILLEMERPRAAVNDCTAALNLNADSGTAFKIRGKAYSKLGRWEEAHHDISAGLKIDYDEQTDDLGKIVFERMHKSRARQESEKNRRELSFKTWLQQRENACRQQRAKQKKSEMDAEEQQQEEESKRQKLFEASVEASPEESPHDDEPPEEDDLARFSLGASLGLGISDMTDLRSQFGASLEDDDLKVIDPSGWPVEEKKFYENLAQTPFPSSMKVALTKQGLPLPPPIQQYTWPLAVENCDVVGVITLGAATVSARTLAFLLPAFAYLVEHGIEAGDPTLLIIAPTREMVGQIHQDCVRYGKCIGIQTICGFGGPPNLEQSEAIRQGIHAVVGTPEGLQQFVDNDSLNLQSIAKLVLDSVDRMLDLGFESQIRAIVDKIPKQRQTLFFTSAWPPAIRKFASEMLRNAHQIQIGKSDASKLYKMIVQIMKMCRPANTKNEILYDTLKEAGFAPNSATPNATAKGLVFCENQKMCDTLSQILNRWKIPSASLNGQRSKEELDACVSELNGSKIKLLVSTDAATRGLGIKGISLVINYDVPKKERNYMERIRWAGQAGRKGQTVTLVTEQDAQSIRGIIRIMRQNKQEVPKAIEHISRHVNVVMRGSGAW